MSIFATIGGMLINHLFLRSRYVPTAPISVAILPNTISHTTPPANMFEIMQPISSPGIAAGVNAGRMQRASEILNWNTPDESPDADAIQVNTTYSAAMSPPIAMLVVCLFARICFTIPFNVRLTYVITLPILSKSIPYRREYNLKYKFNQHLYSRYYDYLLE